MKRKIKNDIIIGMLLCGAATDSFAIETNGKIGAVIDVEGVYYQTNGDDTQKKFSTYENRYGLYSSGNFSIDYQLVADSGWKYGTKLSLQLTTRNDRGVPLSIYTESEYGKIEAGSDKTASAKMMITGYSISCGGGNGWDAFIITSPKKGREAKVPYVTNFGIFLDAKTRTSLRSDYSRKITYYTPKFGMQDHKFQLGISYIPDSSNAGHDDINKAHIHPVLAASQFKFAIKDGVSYGATYNGKFSDQLSAKVAVVGERGKPIAFNKTDNSRSDKKFKDLNTYNIGAEITYNQFSVAGSFMTYNNSLSNTTVDTLGTKTNIYCAGTRYMFAEGKYAASLNHFHSNHKNNKIDATSIGFDYIIATGIKSYAQITHFQTKGRYFDNGVVKGDGSKGNIFVIGGKISL